jgi:hypothetical protein
VWLHASPERLSPREFVLPPSETGRCPNGWSTPLEVSGRYRRDLVYLVMSDEANQCNRSAFTGPAQVIYDVVPVDHPVPDPDPIMRALDSYFCAQACVVRIVRRC